MSIIHKLTLGWMALRELGVKQLSLYLWYRSQLQTGLLKMRTPARWEENAYEMQFLLQEVPSREKLLELLGEAGLNYVKKEADQILAGKVRVFGGDAVPMNFEVPGELRHWVDYERGDAHLDNVRDIKFIWEIGRFGWAFTLARAYLLTGDEQYVEGYLDLEKTFFRHNPPNLGPQWSSAQEVAIRLIALVFTAQIFSGSLKFTQKERAEFSRLIALHARRIVPTIAYARSQNNNHLILEALGLVTASLCLPTHPAAKRWYRLGWRWLVDGFEGQIDDEGVYIQQSVNYQRMIIQGALWANRILKNKQVMFPHQVVRKIKLAVEWLLSITDPISGKLPNLGHNDGTYLFPLTVCPYDDYRPVLQAASLAFLQKPAFQNGVWDEMALWMCDANLELDLKDKVVGGAVENPQVLRDEKRKTWGYLRVASFHGRPAHADLLHFDLWWQGLNIAQDAGTYLYNAEYPWDNRLCSTDVHNTITVNGEDQMLRAGRFLYLGKANSKLLHRDKNEDGESISAIHDGYGKLNLIHQRTVILNARSQWIWTIEDEIRPLDASKLVDSCLVRLHWLVPDWKWKLICYQENSLYFTIMSPMGAVNLRIAAKDEDTALMYQLVREGRLIAGDGKEISPNWGWVSPTYGVKKPALSLGVLINAKPPVILTSSWSFPKVKSRDEM